MPPGVVARAFNPIGKGTGLGGFGDRGLERTSVKLAADGDAQLADGVAAILVVAAIRRRSLLSSLGQITG
jgi:hypothetical protein